MPESIFIHPSADVSPTATIGEETKIWNQAQVGDAASIGRSCVLGKGVFVDEGVSIGDSCKLQNRVSVFRGVTLEDGVFCGPHAVFTNDRVPRAVNPDLTLKRADEWTLTRTLVRTGASIGANAVIVCGVTIGRWAMVGAGSVVTRDVPDHALVLGNPARLVGHVCRCGGRLAPSSMSGRWICPTCRAEIVFGDVP